MVSVLLLFFVFFLILVTEEIRVNFTVFQQCREGGRHSETLLLNITPASLVSASPEAVSQSRMA